MFNNCLENSIQFFHFLSVQLSGETTNEGKGGNKDIKGALLINISGYFLS